METMPDFNVIAQRISFGQSILEISKDFIAQGFDDSAIFLAYVAARMLLESR